MLLKSLGKYYLTITPYAVLLFIVYTDTDTAHCYYYCSLRIRLLLYYYCYRRCIVLVL